MFKLEFFVDDKNLGEAKKRLAGIARNLTDVYVPNLDPKPDGKMRITASDSVEMFLKELAKRKISEFDAKKAREICVGMGFARTSYSYVLKNAIEQGFLRKSGTPQKMHYHLKAEK